MAHFERKPFANKEPIVFMCVHTCVCVCVCVCVGGWMDGRADRWVHKPRTEFTGFLWVSGFTCVSGNISKHHAAVCVCVCVCVSIIFVSDIIPTLG